MICSTVRPAQSRAGPVVPGALGAGLSLGEQLFVVDARRAAVFDDDFAIDEDGFDIGAAAVFDQGVDRIAYRAVTRGAQIDDDDVGLGADGEPAQIVRAPGQWPRRWSRR